MKYALSLAVLFFPVITSAQTIQDGIGTVGGIIDSLVPILIGIALLTFIWGIIKYILSKDEESQKEARGIMIWGIIGLFVIVAVWGIVGLLAETFGIDVGGSTNIPSVPGL